MFKRRKHKLFSGEVGRKFEEQQKELEQIRKQQKKIKREKGYIAFVSAVGLLFLWSVAMWIIYIVIPFERFIGAWASIVQHLIFLLVGAALFGTFFPIYSKYIKD